MNASGELRWYVAHTYAGYENKVKDNIEKTVENRNLHDLIAEVCIPEQEEVVVEFNNGDWVFIPGDRAGRVESINVDKFKADVVVMAPDGKTTKVEVDLGQIEIPKSKKTDTEKAIKEGKVVAKKKGVKIASRKVIPGYVFVKMVMTNESWYIVRNTRGCTGFVGPDSKPVPLTEHEVYSLGVEKKEINIDFEVGDNVCISEGSMEGFMGEIRAIDKERLKITVMVTMFGGREMELEVDLNEVEAL